MGMGADIQVIDQVAAEPLSHAEMQAIVQRPDANGQDVPRLLATIRKLQLELKNIHLALDWLDEHGKGRAR